SSLDPPGFLLGLRQHRDLYFPWFPANKHHLRTVCDSRFAGPPVGLLDDLLFPVLDLGLRLFMENEEIARRFNRMAALMEVRAEDPFRVRSYRMAAEAIETWPTPLSTIAKETGVAGLQEIPGVGKAIAVKIVELVYSGTFDAWERLTSETPETVLDLLEL